MWQSAVFNNNLYSYSSSKYVTTEVLLSNIKNSVETSTSPTCEINDYLRRHGDSSLSLIKTMKI